MKGFSGALALIVVWTLFAAGCGESYRVEPLLLERGDVARSIVANQGDAAQVAAAEAVVARFVKHLQQEECDGAWGMLSEAYRQRFAQVAQNEDARALFCQGFKVDGEMLVKGDWVEFLLGAQAFYLTSVPPELGFENRPGAALYYVVQRDGSYRTLLIRGTAENASLEPF